MKKLIVLISFIIIAVNGYCQSYIPMRGNVAIIYSSDSLKIYRDGAAYYFISAKPIHFQTDSIMIDTIYFEDGTKQYTYIDWSDSIANVDTVSFAHNVDSAKNNFAVIGNINTTNTITTKNLVISAGNISCNSGNLQIVTATNTTQPLYIDNTLFINKGTFTTISADSLVIQNALSIYYNTITATPVKITIASTGDIDKRILIIKDSGGNAGTNNITINTQSGKLIDGSSTYVINTDYGSVILQYYTNKWNVLSKY